MSGPRLSIVIASWNTRELLADCLRTIPAGAAATEHRVVVVDNASDDGSADLVAAEFPQVLLIRNARNCGFAQANNQGIAALASDYVLLLNSDTRVPAGAIDRLAAFLDAHADAGAAGPRLTRPDGTPQPYAFGGDPTLPYLLMRGAKRLMLRRPMHDWATEVVQVVDWVSGAAMMVRRAAIGAAGPLDSHLFLYFEDNEWCMRIRQAGWRVYYDPGVSIVHLGGQSLARNPGAQRAYYESLLYVYDKHYGRAARACLRLALALYRRIAPMRPA